MLPTFCTESTPANGVVISGATVNETITFLAQGLMQLLIPIDIIDDNVGQENVEVFPLEFTSSDPSEESGRVSLGPDATVMINDNDGNILQTTAG